jgi:hypothetical protein
MKFDAILVCSTNMQGINALLSRAQKGIKVNILGEVSLGELDKGIIEEAYGSLSFCNSFGYGRRIWDYEQLGKVNTSEFPFSIHRNVQDSINVITNEQTAARLRILVKTHNLSTFCPSLGAIDIIEYR